MRTHISPESSRVLRPASTFFLLGLALSVVTASTTRADCPPPPTTDLPTGIIEGRVTELTQGSLNSACGVDGQNRFAVVYETPIVGAPFQSDHDVFIQRFEADGVCICEPGDACPGTLTNPDPGLRQTFNHISVDMNGGTPQISPLVFVSFLGACQSCFGLNRAPHFTLTFDFITVPFLPPFVTTSPAAGIDEFFPSVGIADTDVSAVTFASELGSPPGLVYDVIDLPAFPAIRGCAPFCYVQPSSAWQPCLASKKDDGSFCIAWADAELPVAVPPFDIRVQQYDASGTALGNEVVVNDPAADLPLSRQMSPAVDMG